MALRRVAIVGSGNWGSTIAKIVGNNVCHHPRFEKEIRMWVFKEMIGNKDLTDIINEQHENVKYLPGVKLPTNVVATSDLKYAVEEADVLVFVIPHQFLQRTCATLKPFIKSTAYGVSLMKGLAMSGSNGVRLLSDLIRDELSIPCAVIMGANLADEVSRELFCEATIGANDTNRGEELKLLFETPYFRMAIICDEVGAELCGALKNIVALGAGMIEGLGYGDNTKAAVIRLGFMEMRKFIYKFFSEREPQEGTFLESCGVADLITTCYGGRNKQIGIGMTQGEASVQDLERELLNGQSAQGPLTASEVNAMLTARNLLHEFPLFTAVHRICKRELKPTELVACLANHPEHE